MKIKNWRRIPTAAEAAWEHDVKKSRSRIVVDGEKSANIPFSRIAANPRMSLSARDYLGWHVMKQFGARVVWEKTFARKEDAMSYAIKYMRRHPNG